MIDGDRALHTFVVALFSLHGLVFHLSTVGAPPRHPRHPCHPPLLRVHPVLPQPQVRHRRRNRPRSLYNEFVWMVASLHSKPAACVKRDGCWLHLNGCSVWIWVWVWDPSGVGV